MSKHNTKHSFNVCDFLPNKKIRYESSSNVINDSFLSYVYALDRTRYDSILYVDFKQLITEMKANAEFDFDICYLHGFACSGESCEKKKFKDYKFAFYINVMGFKYIFPQPIHFTPKNVKFFEALLNHLYKFYETHHQNYLKMKLAGDPTDFVVLNNSENLVNEKYCHIHKEVECICSEKESVDQLNVSVEIATCIFKPPIKIANFKTKIGKFIKRLYDDEKPLNDRYKKFKQASFMFGKMATLKTGKSSLFKTNVLGM